MVIKNVIKKHLKSIPVIGTFIFYIIAVQNNNSKGLLIA